MFKITVSIIVLEKSKKIKYNLIYIKRRILF